MKIRNWKEAERAMGDFAHLETKVSQAKTGMEISIQAAQDRFFKRTERLVERQKEIEAALCRFARANKNGFQARPNGDGRSRNFNGVRFGNWWSGTPCLMILTLSGVGQVRPAKPP